MEHRFWAKVSRTDGDGCWEWTAALYPRGYGKFSIRGKLLEGAHRMAWILTHGPITNGLWVLHKCDNRRCCRPSHLFLGTARDNVHDMIAKGRARFISGGSDGGGHNGGVFGLPQKLSSEEKAYIISAASMGVSHRQLAARFAVDRRSIDRFIVKLKATSGVGHSHHQSGAD